MKKVAIIYWSGTGNTEMMAQAIQEGAGSGAELFFVDKFDVASVGDYDVFALGCPSMGAEELEGDFFQPFWDEFKTAVGDKPVVLFGSYGWGDGEWMRLWEEEAKDAGINLSQPYLLCHETPESDDIENCKNLGMNISI